MADQKQTTLSDDDLRHVLKLHADAGGDLVSLSVRMVHLKRRDEEASRKAAQPELNLRAAMGGDVYERVLGVLRGEFRKPLTDAEKAAMQSGLDLWLLNLQDTLDAGDLEDFVLASVRLARQTWGSQFVHVGLAPDPAQWPEAARRQFGR